MKNKSVTSKNVTENVEFKVIGTDQNGQPLYQRVVTESATGAIIEQPLGTTPSISPELLKLKRKRSLERYPDIGLEMNETEYVVTEVRRSKLGLIGLWAVDIGILILIATVWILALSANSFIDSIPNTNQDFMPKETMTVALFATALIVLLFGWVASNIYKANHIIVTNQRLIQTIAKGLFDRKVQSVNLGGVEDVSFHKAGFVDSMLDIGSVKLSTVGEESTYNLRFVDNPEEVANDLSAIVQAAKNNQPIPSIN